ncbi:MAG: bifunctional DNA-binding transcriptional regulator/O6-methylguanine-DNA methyltransferase Ada [Janthinobacterium lividum]
MSLDMEIKTTDTTARLQAIAERDPAYDGRFYYAVRTTGVYCSPSCASRTARPENILFYDRLEDAEQAGFRPCRRCRPNEAPRHERQAAVIAAACRMIEAADEPPTLDALAEASGMSSYYFHRTFRAVIGVTPKAYANAHRTKLVQEELRRGERSVSETIYEAGFHSSGRFYESAAEMLGMTPTEYKQGGRNTEIYFAVGESTLGSVLVARSAKGVCAILLGDDSETLVRDLQSRFPVASLVGGDTDFEAVVAQVIGFVEDPARGLDLPLDVRGTAFQQRVWEAMRRIPVGKTVSYAEIARILGSPKSVRAVAGACAANALAVAIPCHRVVRSDGGLSGYRWGIERKRELLRREGST